MVINKYINLGESPAEKIKDFEGKTLSAGQKKERVRIESPDLTYDIACKRFSGNNQKPHLSYLEKKFWTPLKLADGSIVLLNINSLAKRMGIDKKELLKASKSGDYQIVENLVKNSIERKENLLAFLKPFETKAKAKIADIDKFLEIGVQNILDGTEKKQLPIQDIVNFIEQNKDRLKDKLKKKDSFLISHALLGPIKVNSKGIEIENAFISWEQIDHPQAKLVPPQASADKLINQTESTFKTCSKNEVLELQQDIQIVNEKHGQLKLSDLEQQNLLPKHKMQIGEATYYCSDVFTLTDKSAVFALVEIKGKVYPRIFYQSSSQGTWRCMPSGQKRDDEIRHFGKGKGETDTQVPFALNFALYKLPQDKKTQKKFGDQVVATKLRPTYLGNISENIFFDGLGARKVDLIAEKPTPYRPNPSVLQLPKDPNKHPNFSNVLHEATIDTPLYGKVKAKVFASNDGSNQFLFYENSEGKAFLAGVELVKDIPINHYGLRNEFYKLEGMDAPLKEYRKQIPDNYVFNAKNDIYMDQNAYNSFWNYVREIPIVQLYYSAQGRVIPEAETE